MSPSSPLRARRCAGGGGQNVMHPRGGKLGFVTVSLENGQGEKYFIPARETVTNSCGSWGVPPRARRPSFFRLWLMSSLYLHAYIIYAASGPVPPSRPSRRSVPRSDIDHDVKAPSGGMHRADGSRGHPAEICQRADGRAQGRDLQESGREGPGQRFARERTGGPRA